jgi:(2S)-methylsuccinyl-CoA dehydrogenase
MSASAAFRPVDQSPIDAVALGRAATARLEKLLAEATSAVRARVTDGPKISSALLEQEQRATHGLAWFAT